MNYPRDPNRIRAILNKIAALWENAPDLRFFQLILLMIPLEYTKHISTEDEGLRLAFLSPHNIEDDRVEEILDRLIKEYGKYKV